MEDNMKRFWEQSKMIAFIPNPTRNAVIIELIDEGEDRVRIHIECKDTDRMDTLTGIAHRLLRGERI